MTRLTQAERLAQIEVRFDMLEKKIADHSDDTKEGFRDLKESIEKIGTSWDDKYVSLEGRVSIDEKELARLTNRGTGMLALLGVIFTVTATWFSHLFASLKHTIFG